MDASRSGRIIGVVGFKDSGKTRIVEGLVRFLSSRGFRVGTVKHVHEGPTLEPPAKDSLKHLDAGASVTVVVGGEVVQVLRRDGEDLEGVIDKYLSVCDYIVVEGFKHVAIPKIAAVSGGEDILTEAGDICAAVFRDAKPEGYPAFTFDEIDKLGNFLFEKKILTEPSRRVSLVVNGKAVPMNEFVQASLTGVIKGFVASLRDVEEPATIDLSISLGTEGESSNP